MPKHAGHVTAGWALIYPINPGSSCSGPILTTSSIVALHRGHAMLLRFFEMSDTTKDPLTGFEGFLMSVNASWDGLVSALRPSVSAKSCFREQ
jgi:hypothetical protein